MKPYEGENIGGSGASSQEGKGRSMTERAEELANRAKGSASGTGETVGGFDRYIDYEVVDESEDKIGTLNCVWLDRSGQPAFLGIKTGWLFGKTHLVPADKAEVKRGNKRMRLPFSKEMIKGAPAFGTDKDLDLEEERQVRGYFKMSEVRLEEGEFEETEKDLGTEERAPQPRFEQPSTPARPGMEETRIPLREEQVKIGKRSVESGGVRLRKIVRTETVNQPVELLREEIVIERVPGTPGQPATGEAFAQEDVYIPLRREEPVVQKESQVTEEVRARKESHAEMQDISEQVRKEDVEIEKEGQEVNRLKKKEEHRDLP